MLDEDDAHGGTVVVPQARRQRIDRKLRSVQNLRDKLLKAGVVSARQVEEAEKAPERRAAEQRQVREAFAEQDAEQAARRAEAKMQSERAHRIKALVEAHRVRDPGEAKFHYLRRNGKIARVDVSPATAKLLESGAAAVVDDPGQPECAVVPGAAAQRIHALDPKAIRFWSGPEKPIGFEDAGDA